MEVIVNEDGFLGSDLISIEEDFIEFWKKESELNYVLLSHRKDLFSGEVSCLGVNSSGTKIAIGYKSGIIRILSISGNQEKVEVIAELNEHTSAITALSFNASDTQLLSSGKDGMALIWDMNYLLNHEPIRLPGHSGWVWDASFSADGASILTACEDRVTRIFPSKTKFIFDQLCPLNPALKPEDLEAIIHKYMDNQAEALPLDCK